MSAGGAVLHVGGPKCGSSALQTALTQHPDLTGADGCAIRYVACRQQGTHWRPIRGEVLRLTGRRSPYGYVCWPNFARHQEPEPILEALDAVFDAGASEGYLPVVSSEGWIAHAALIGEWLAARGHPPVTVVAFVRPPLEWLNAAYWQWGIWHGWSFPKWVARSNLTYRFGSQLAEWAQTPNVSLQIRPSRRDVVAAFGEILGATVPASGVRNVASPPALIGFLLRNRRFRPTPHDASAEFVFQRWCPPVPGPTLWALAPDDVHAVRAATNSEVRRLLEVVGPAEAEALLEDQGWLREKPYHDKIQAGHVKLADPAGLPPLFAALAEGIGAATRAAGARAPDLPAAPSAAASIETWDGVLGDMLEKLLEADARLRARSGPVGVSGVWEQIARLHGRLRRSHGR